MALNVFPFFFLFYYFFCNWVQATIKCTNFKFNLTVHLQTILTADGFLNFFELLFKGTLCNGNIQLSAEDKPSESGHFDKKSGFKFDTSCV